MFRTVYMLHCTLFDVSPVACLCFFVYRSIGALGHGKYVVDVLNSFYKHYLMFFMMKNMSHIKQ